MTLSGPGVPVRDRVLIHLSEFRNLGDALEVPNGMSQAGIALALDVNRSQVTRALAELRAKDLVDERVTYVKGAARRCRTYSCTFPGEEYAGRLKTMLLDAPAGFRDSSGAVRTLRVGEVYADLRATVPFSRFLIAILEDRVMLDYARADADARPRPVIVGGERAPPAGETGAAAQAEEVKALDEPAMPAIPKAAQIAGPAGTDGPDALEMDAPAPAGPPPDVRDYRATYDSVLPSRFYDPERAPAPPGRDPRDPRQYQAQKPRTDDMVPLFGALLFLLSVVGLLVMLFAGAPFYGTGCICFFWVIIGLVVSGFLLVSWSSKVERTGLLRLPQRERLVLTGILVGATATTLLFLGALTGATGGRGLDASDLLAIFMVGVPLYGAVLVRSGMPEHVRSELGVSAGWFMLLASAGVQLFSNTIEYSVWMTGVWMTLGVGLVIMASDIGALRPGPMLVAALPGLGGAAAILCALAIFEGRAGWAGDVLGLLALAAWVGMGLFLVALPFLRDGTQRSLQGTLGSVGLMAFGVALVFLGLGLVRAGIFVGAVELVLAAPALYYGWRRFREAPGEGKLRRAGLLSVVLAVVMITLSRALFIF